jgi:6,7-dimethyl-8-ribityllumazine synthase
MAERIALISATWHGDLVAESVGSARKTLESGNDAPEIDEFSVPGSFELPLLAKKLAESGEYDAIIAFGLVVDGGIYRHEFVAGAVIDGLMRVMLDSNIPVFSSVLTPQQFHEHGTHLDFFRTHLGQKGREVAAAAQQTLAVHRQLAAD